MDVSHDLESTMRMLDREYRAAIVSLDLHKPKRTDRRIGPSRKWKMLRFFHVAQERRCGFDRRARVATQPHEQSLTA